MGSSRLVPVPDAFNMTFSDIRIYQATDACCLFCPRQGFCAAQKDLYFYFFVKHTSRKSVSVLVGTSLKFRASIDILARDLSTDPPPPSSSCQPKKHQFKKCNGSSTRLVFSMQLTSISSACISVCVTFFFLPLALVHSSIALSCRDKVRTL